MEVSKEAFQEWLSHPVTEALHLLLEREIQASKDRWARGEFFRDSHAEARILGAHDAAKSVLELTQEDLNELE